MCQMYGSDERPAVYAPAVQCRVFSVPFVWEKSFMSYDNLLNIACCLPVQL
jgi:hypothetical protein